MEASYQLAFTFGKIERSSVSLGEGGDDAFLVGNLMGDFVKGILPAGLLPLARRSGMGADFMAGFRRAFIAVGALLPLALVLLLGLRGQAPDLRPQLDLPDPFAAHDDAVAALVEEIRTSLPHHPGGRSGLGWLRHGLGDLERGG